MSYYSISSSDSEEEVTSKIRGEPVEKFTPLNYEVPITIKLAKYRPHKPALMMQTPRTYGGVEKDIRGRQLSMAVRGLVKNGLEDYRRTGQAKEMVGTIVNKISDVGFHTGVVVDYDEQEELFKIEYEDDFIELVNMPALLELVVPAKTVSKCTNPVEAREDKKRKRDDATTSSYSSN